MQWNKLSASIAVVRVIAAGGFRRESLSQLNLIRVAPHRAAIYTSDIREANSVKPDHASRNKHDQVFNRLVATPVISSPLNCPSVRTRTRIQFSSIGLHHRAWILHFRRPLVGWVEVFVSFALFVSGLWRSLDRHYHPIPLSSHLSVPYEPVFDYLDVHKFREAFPSYCPE